MIHHAAPGRQHRSRGFSLVELLVVIAVLSLLMSLLLPALSSAREQGKKAVCLANLKGLGVAFLGYAQEYENVVAYNAAYAPYGAGTDSRSWDDLLNPYLGDNLTQLADLAASNVPISKGNKILVCPSDYTLPRQAYSWSGGVVLAPRSYALIRGPFYQSTPYFRFPGFFQQFSSGAPGSTSAIPPCLRFNENDVPRPAQTILLTEFWASSTFGGTMNNIQGDAGATFVDNDNATVPTSWSMTKQPTHVSVYSYLFADGHAEGLPYKDTISTGTVASPKGSWTRLRPY